MKTNAQVSHFELRTTYRVPRVYAAHCLLAGAPVGEVAAQRNNAQRSPVARYYETDCRMK